MGVIPDGHAGIEISIHALREEGDFLGPTSICDIGDFYPRPPRGGRLCGINLMQHGGIFLSTPSARRATSRFYCQRLCRIYFYPRPPRGGRPWPDGLRWHLSAISIHALREEGDNNSFRFTAIPLTISIHALREEGDGVTAASLVPVNDISIHALREEGDVGLLLAAGRGGISIHALREEGDAPRLVDQKKRPRISIHALREEGDSTPARRRSWLIYFYPRPPRGGRR